MTTEEPRSCIYDGVVMHRRLMPVAHGFSYRVFSLFVDIDRLDDLDRRLRLFSVGRFNVFAFHNRDHGRRDGSAIRPWIEEQLARKGFAPPARIMLHCFPRLLGFVFNPLSVYYCYDERPNLVAVLYEVKNTFGGQHCYTARIDNPASFDHGCDKQFYVSPFINRSGHYRFGGHQPGNRYHLTIRKHGVLGCELEARQTGQRKELTDIALLKRFFTYPLMTLKVITAIHIEALRLWLKGAPRFARPNATTVG